MAREAGLPEQIVDIIPQHHGTRLMTYFYEKAQAGGRAGDASSSDDDFRYPGPKPQTREAAIFMLADGVEAAARTVDEPTPSRLQEMIRQVTQRDRARRQLDECDLTFADLERVQRCAAAPAREHAPPARRLPGVRFRATAGGAAGVEAGHVRR